MRSCEHPLEATVCARVEIVDKYCIGATGSGCATSIRFGLTNLVVYPFYGSISLVKYCFSHLKMSKSDGGGICFQYVKTGICRFGSRCKYAHDESKRDGGSKARLIAFSFFRILHYVVLSRLAVPAKFMA